MTNYSTQDLENNWEFKIVRSETDIFRRPEVFQQLLAEEQMAGWEMVEKLDDRRVRFKRRKDARRNDSRLPQGYDPYRSTYGNSKIRIIVFVITMLFVVLMTGIGLFSEIENGLTFSNSAPMILVITLVIAVSVAMFSRRR